MLTGVYNGILKTEWLYKITIRTREECELPFSSLE